MYTGLRSRLDYIALYTGDGNMVGTVKIVEQYKTVNSSYELAVQGKYNLVEVLRMQVSILLIIVLAWLALDDR